MPSFIAFAAACSLVLPSASLGELDPNAPAAQCPPDKYDWECAPGQYVGTDVSTATEEWTFWVGDAHVYSWDCDVSRTLLPQLEGLEGFEPIVTWMGPSSPTPLAAVFALAGSALQGDGCGFYFETIEVDNEEVLVVGGSIPIWVSNGCSSSQITRAERDRRVVA